MDGAELRRARQRLGLSQEQMAEELGVKPNTVARWERGEIKIGATVAKLVRLLNAQRQRAPGRGAADDVVLDEYHRQILLALEEHLDPEVFEQCAVHLIGKTGLPVAPVVGGGDAGFDGAIVDLDRGRPIPLVVTTSARPSDNLKRSIESAKNQNPGLNRACFATSRSLTPHMRRRLSHIAEEEGVHLLSIYDRAWFALALYRDPAWCKRLLSLTGRPRALSQFPKGSRTIEADHLVGRDEAIEWLKSREGDCLLLGVPGSGKTFLLHSLANELGALFLVDNDGEKIADDIRELSPKAIIIDDAHTDIAALKSLVQLRAQIGADDLRLVATSWPGYGGGVAGELSLPESEMHELALIPADEMIEVINAHGIHGPPSLLAFIRSQACGRPGLAGTLATLALRGDFKRILGGDVLLEELAPQLISMVGDDAIPILAYFALGGDSGATPERVSEHTGESRINIENRLANLAAAGILQPLRDNRIVVVPEALRLALVKEVFFGNPVRKYQDALEAVANRHDGILTLIRASARGATIPDLWDLLRKANSQTLWAEFAKLGEREALHVIERGLSRYDLVAEQGLHYVPEVMIPLLLDQLPDPWPTFGAENHPAVRALREWVVDRRDDFPRDEIGIRRGLVKATSNWWRQSGRTYQAIHAMSLALQPTFSINGLDPGAGTTGTLRSFLFNSTIRQAQMELWVDVLDLVKQVPVVPWKLLLSLAAAWIQGERVPKDSADEMRQFSEKILGDLAHVTEDHPGIQSILNHRAKAWELEIDVALDPLYEAAFPKGGPFTAEEDKKRVAHFVSLVDGLSPSALAAKLVYVAKERTYAGHSSDGLAFLKACQHLANQLPDLVAFIENLVDRGAEQDLVEPFFQQAATAGAERFGNLVFRLLDHQKYEHLAVQHLLVNEDTPFPVLADALERADRHPFLLSNLAGFGRLNSEATRRLLTGSDEALATIAAAGYRRKGRARRGDANYDVWRDAVVRSARSVDLGDGQVGWSIKEILKGDAELARDWLIELISADKHWLDFHDDYAEVVAAMTSQQRLHILERIEERPVIGIDDIVRQLVGNDLELFAQALRMNHLSNYRTKVLAGRPDEIWLKKAILAMDAGLSISEIVDAIYSLPMMWMGEESKMWSEWRDDFERLTEREHDDPRVARLLQIAIDSARNREESAKAREAKESIHGFGER